MDGTEYEEGEKRLWRIKGVVVVSFGQRNSKKMRTKKGRLNPTMGCWYSMPCGPCGMVGMTWVVTGRWGGVGSDKRRILLNNLCRLGKRLGLSSPYKSEEWQRALSSVSDLEGNSWEMPFQQAVSKGHGLWVRVAELLKSHCFERG